MTGRTTSSLWRKPQKKRFRWTVDKWNLSINSPRNSVLVDLIQVVGPEIWDFWKFFYENRWILCHWLTLGSSSRRSSRSHNRCRCWKWSCCSLWSCGCEVWSVSPVLVDHCVVLNVFGAVWSQVGEDSSWAGSVGEHGEVSIILRRESRQQSGDVVHEDVVLVLKIKDNGNVKLSIEAGSKWWQGAGKLRPSGEVVGAFESTFSVVGFGDDAVGSGHTGPERLSEETGWARVIDDEDESSSLTLQFGCGSVELSLLLISWDIRIENGVVGLSEEDDVSGEAGVGNGLGGQLIRNIGDGSLKISVSSTELSKIGRAVNQILDKLSERKQRSVSFWPELCVPLVVRDELIGLGSGLQCCSLVSDRDDILQVLNNVVIRGLTDFNGKVSGDTFWNMESLLNKLNLKNSLGSGHG